MIKKKASKFSRSNKKYSKFAADLKLEQVDWQKVEKIFSAENKIIRRYLAREERLSLSSKDLLKLLAGGMVIGLSLVFPTLPMALAPLLLKRKRLNSGHFSQTMARLRKQKLVEIVEEKGQTLVKITQAGRIRALHYKLEEMAVKKPKVWDRKWRVVIFDIPEKYKRMRELFRDRLKTMDFYPLQKSVWVHPYPCFDEIEFLRQIFHISINVTYIVANSIESTEDLKVRFQLD